MNMIVRPLALALLVALPLVASAQNQGSSAGSQGSNLEVQVWNKEFSGAMGGGNGWRPGNGLARSVGGNSQRCSVTDLVAFADFIAGKPTPGEFRATYSCVTLALPGDLTSREIRPDNSRYFADLDAHGRIVGGYFQ